MKGDEDGGPRQGDPGQARRAEPGELANVRLWLGADIQRESAERPVLTLSGHSGDYDVQQVGTEKSKMAAHTTTVAPVRCLFICPVLPRSPRLAYFFALSSHRGIGRMYFASAICFGQTIMRLPFWI